MERQARQGRMGSCQSSDVKTNMTPVKAGLKQSAQIGNSRLTGLKPPLIGSCIPVETSHIEILNGAAQSSAISSHLSFVM